MPVRKTIRIAGQTVDAGEDGKPLLPPLAGGDETPEEKAAREAQEAREAADRAEADRIEAERQQRQDPDDPRNWDPERARRTILAQRQAEQEANTRAEHAEAALRQIEQANETERETAERERDEERQRNDRLAADLRASRLDIAIRDVAGARDVPQAKIRRLSQLVQADGVRFDDDGHPQGIEDAVDTVLEDMPELLMESGTGSSSPANGQRRRSEREMTVEEAKTIAKNDPEKFNRLWDDGKIPAGALGKS